MGGVLTSELGSEVKAKFRAVIKAGTAQSQPVHFQIFDTAPACVSVP